MRIVSRISCLYEQLVLISVSHVQLFSCPKTIRSPDTGWYIGEDLLIRAENLEYYLSGACWALAHNLERLWSDRRNYSSVWKSPVCFEIIVGGRGRIPHVWKVAVSVEIWPEDEIIKRIPFILCMVAPPQLNGFYRCVWSIAVDINPTAVQDKAGRIEANASVIGLRGRPRWSRQGWMHRRSNLR